MDRRAGLQLGVLLLAVPVQYLVSQLLFTTESQRTYAIRNLLNDASGLKDEYLSWQSWKRWCVRIIHGRPYFEGEDDPNGESPAVEVINHMDPKGYFAASAEPRTHRPPEVKYRIGQVIKHKRWGYKGVIVGWDEIAKAPEYWIKSNHPPGKEVNISWVRHLVVERFVKNWRMQPNYAILVDTRDRLSPQITYVPQENLDIIINMQVLHPSIEEYFEKFDGAQYLPRPWLKAVYPYDN